MVEVQFLDALKRLHSRLHEHDVNWALTGSLSFALHGIDIAAHDIDIQTDRSGAYAIEQLFSEYSITPVTFSSADRIRSYFGALEICGVTVEVMGDIQKFIPGVGWEPPVNIEPHKTWLTVDDMRIPVLSLEYEYRAYLLLGRLKWATILRRWLDQSVSESD